MGQGEAVVIAIGGGGCGQESGALKQLLSSVMKSRDCVNPVSNLETGTQFRDFENVQRNLEIAQIPRLPGTHISLIYQLNIHIHICPN